MTNLPFSIGDKVIIYRYFSNGVSTEGKPPTIIQAWIRNKKVLEIIGIDTSDYNPLYIVKGYDDGLFEEELKRYSDIVENWEQETKDLKLKF